MVGAAADVDGRKGHLPRISVMKEGPLARAGVYGRHACHERRTHRGIKSACPGGREPWKLPALPRYYIPAE